MTRRPRCLAVVWALLVAVSVAGVAGEVTITFYHTSDLHEHSARLARIARFVEHQRAAGKNVVFIDTGDWFNKGDLTTLGLRGEAMADLMGAMAYDVVIPGNHDYSHGTKRLAELIDKYSLPLAAANCRWPDDARPTNAKPYRVFKFGGATVAVIGTATPIMGNASDRLLTVRPIAESVKATLATLEGTADIIVLLTHLGPPEDRKLIRALPRVDILFGGHHHKKFRTLDFNRRTKTILQHSGCFGECIGEVVIKWDGEKIVHRSVRLVTIAARMPESPKVAAIRAKYKPKTAK